MHISVTYSLTRALINLLVSWKESNGQSNNHKRTTSMLPVNVTYAQCASTLAKHLI